MTPDVKDNSSSSGKSIFLIDLMDAAVATLSANEFKLLWVIARQQDTQFDKTRPVGFFNKQLATLAGFSASNLVRFYETRKTLMDGRWLICDGLGNTSRQQINYSAQIPEMSEHRMPIDNRASLPVKSVERIAETASSEQTIPIGNRTQRIAETAPNEARLSRLTNSGNRASSIPNTPSTPNTPSGLPTFELAKQNSRKPDDLIDTPEHACVSVIAGTCIAALSGTHLGRLVARRKSR